MRDPNRMPDAPNCRGCLEEMQPWPGNLWLCVNADCAEYLEPVDEETVSTGQGDGCGGGYCSSERAAAAQQVGR